MRIIIDKFMPVALATMALIAVHGSEAMVAVRYQPDAHDCGCSIECACRGPSQDCSCSRSDLTMNSRCGCGGPGPHQAGAASSWKTVFTSACSVGAPHLSWPLEPDMGDPQEWHLPYEHEHPPRTLP